MVMMQFAPRMILKRTHIDEQRLLLHLVIFIDMKLLNPEQKQDLLLEHFNNAITQLCDQNLFHSYNVCVTKIAQMSPRQKEY